MAIPQWMTKRCVVENRDTVLDCAKVLEAYAREHSAAGNRDEARTLRHAASRLRDVALLECTWQQAFELEE